MIDSKANDEKRSQLVPCLSCKKIVNTSVHHYRSFKGHYLHIRCANMVFSNLIHAASVELTKALIKSTRKIKKISKMDKCLICGEHASGANGFKHTIVYEGNEVRLKIHRTCFFQYFGMEYDEETKRTKVD
jgi:hypothetical protein